MTGIRLPTRRKVRTPLAGAASPLPSARMAWPHRWSWKILMCAAKELLSGLTNENKSNKAPNPKRQSHNCHPQRREESSVFLPPLDAIIRDVFASLNMTAWRSRLNWVLDLDDSLEVGC